MRLEQLWRFLPVPKNSYSAFIQNSKCQSQPPGAVVLRILLTDFSSPLVKKWLTFPQYVCVVAFSATFRGNKNDCRRCSPNMYCQGRKERIEMRCVCVRDYKMSLAKNEVGRQTHLFESLIHSFESWLFVAVKHSSVAV